MDKEKDWQEKLTALRGRKTVRILALESSCDETAAAVVENGRRALSNVIFSQVDVHALYGGVVPEIASRAHVDACDRVVDRALADAGMPLAAVDALAVTYGRGLVGALLTGVSCMKGWPLHRPAPDPRQPHRGHVSANFLADRIYAAFPLPGGQRRAQPSGAGGGLRRVHPHGPNRGRAAGEAFDKGARVLGLTYPGGPQLSRLAEGGDPKRFPCRPARGGKYDFSFSGLKTAFINACHRLEQRGEPLPKADLRRPTSGPSWTAFAKIAAGAPDSGLSTLCLAGGVSANRLLRGACGAGRPGGLRPAHAGRRPVHRQRRHDRRRRLLPPPEGRMRAAHAQRRAVAAASVAAKWGIP
jgi:N6-L-threonylcarbamoyladenine synthase